MVISQIYTPGGSGGGTTGFERSYVELYNRSGVPVGLGGWSLQYAQVNNSTWIITPLAGTIQPGRYFLVVEGNFTNPGNPPPPADVTGSTFIYPAGGKVALLSSMDAMVGCGAALPLVDLVGYGSTDCSEGGVPAPGLSPSRALFRVNSGCKDTDSNVADFLQANPAPRNSSTIRSNSLVVPESVTSIES